jgi:hypothetical protein
MGASPGPALGAGVIGDIFKLEERGRAMGVFFAVSKLSSILILTFLPYFDSLDMPVWNNYRSFCWRYVLTFFFAFVTVGCTRLTSTMVVQVGLLITVHGERCTAS